MSWEGRASPFRLNRLPTRPLFEANSALWPIGSSSDTLCAQNFACGIEIKLPTSLERDAGRILQYLSHTILIKYPPQKNLFFRKNANLAYGIIKWKLLALFWVQKFAKQNFNPQQVSRGTRVSFLKRETGPFWWNRLPKSTSYEKNGMWPIGSSIRHSEIYFKP